jgi:methylisocitrate lyase
MARAGATALQLEDSSDMEESTKLLPRERYYEKVKAALAALEGSDCILIARTNADPKTELDEGIERCRAAVALGAQMTTVVKLSNLSDARYVASRVPGWKMYPDVAGRNGVAEVTVEDIYPLGYNFMTMHYTLKAAMDGMLEHGKHNFAQQGSLYTCDKKDATGIQGMSATPLFDPRGYMELEAKFSGRHKQFTIVGNEVEDYPEGFVKTPITDRF